MKNQWNAPKLIILVRNRPEEAILLICKQSDGSDVDPANNNGGRETWDYGCLACFDMFGS